ncbi:hypothetical protein V6R21_03280 [Limibacter armeniacum]|uniref:hypothetical protein n=1 Tax=Limibacter armeniacum TaxID=466084 RepID=UPI002FE5B43E
MSAYREAPFGGYWLGLYTDLTWELGNTSREISAKGIYAVNNDTLELTTVKGSYFNGDTINTFIFEGKHLIEVKNTGIKGLEIELNKLRKK